MTAAKKTMNKKPWIEVTQDAETNEFGVVLWLGTKIEKRAEKQIKALLTSVMKRIKKSKARNRNDRRKDD